MHTITPSQLKREVNQRFSMLAADPKLIRQVADKELLDKEIILQIVEKNGLALQFLADCQISKEVCIKAIKQNHRAIQFVPEHLRGKITLADLV